MNELALLIHKWCNAVEALMVAENGGHTEDWYRELENVTKAETELAEAVGRNNPYLVEKRWQSE